MAADDATTGTGPEPGPGDRTLDHPALHRTALDRPTPVTGRAPQLAALFGALLAFVVLRAHAAPGLTFEDAGELVAAAHHFGVPHPPGYPLWTLVAGAWSHAFGWFGVEPARACVLLSVVSTSAACGATAWLLARRGVHAAAAALIGATLATTPIVLALGTVVEVYGLALFVQAVFVAVALDPVPRPRAAWLWFGLGLAAHPGTLFLAPLLLRPSLASAAKGPREVARWALRGAIGPLSYGWVFLRSLADPALDWGDPQTLERFGAHVLRAQYDAGVERTAGDLVATLRLALEHTVGSAWIAIALGLVALVAARRGPRARWWALGTFAFGLAFALFVVRYPFDRMDALARWSAQARVAPSFAPLVLALWVACALGLVHAARRTNAALLAPLVFGVAALAPDSLGDTLDGLDRSSASVGARVWSHEVLAECPPNALLVVGAIGYTDVLGFPLLHAQLVEGMRTDATVIDRQLLLAPWYREQLARRTPELSGWLDGLAASLPNTNDQGALHRAIGAALGGLVGGSREIVWTDPPGPAARGGRAWVPGRLLWFADATPGPDDGLLSAPWLGTEPRTPWRELHRRLATERDLARALRIGGEVGDALRRAVDEVYGPVDPRAVARDAVERSAR